MNIAHDPICVVGAPGSGVFMVAELLQTCGACLFTPKYSSFKGEVASWKNLLYEINGQILKLFGGRWDDPPAFPEGWWNEKQLEPLKEKARICLDQSSFPSVWGWADSATALTLPFWVSLFPNLKVVVCLRDPWEVYRCLYARSYIPREQAFALFLAYYTSVIEATDVVDRIVTHYDAYFTYPRAELARVCAFCGLEPDSYVLDEAVLAIEPSRRCLADSSGHLPPQLAGTYSKLCEEAGLIWRLSSGGNVLPVEGAQYTIMRVLKELEVVIPAIHRECLIRQLKIEYLRGKLDRQLSGEATAREELQRLQKRLTWKRYRIADGVAAVFWYLSKPTKLLQLAGRRSLKIAKKRLPPRIKRFLKLLFYRMR